MSASISISIRKGDMFRAQALLAGVKNGVPRVISRSVNRTLVGVRTDAVREIGRVITPKASVIRKTFRVQKATVHNLSARVESRGKPLGLIHFRARQTRKGVTVQVKKGKGRSLLPGAFIRSMKGAKNVWQRYYHHPPRRPARPGFPYGRLPKRYRLPVYRMAGPRVPDIMGNRDVMAAIQGRADRRLDKNFSHELDFMLSRLR